MAYSIGGIAKEVGIKVPTIRYYEQIGLVDAPNRTQGNQRRYTRAHAERLSFIKHARELGFSLADITSLIELSQTQNQSCEDIDRVASAHLKAVKARISQLKKLQAELSRIVAGCKTDDVGRCYVIESLASHNLCANEHD